MDRRKFLKGGVLSLGAPVAAANVGRLFGTPSSVQPRDIPSLDKFRLPLSQAGVPSELWDGLVRLSYLWESVLTDEAEREAFSRDPRVYFSSLGLDSSDQTLISEKTIMLRAMVDPVVKSGLSEGDYASIYNRFLQLGVFEKVDPSFLQEKIEQAFQQNLDELKTSLIALNPGLSVLQEKELLAAINEAGVTAAADDLLFISRLLTLEHGRDTQPMCTALALCVVAVGIAATVVAYVSVVTTVTVGILAGVYVSAAVQVAVKAGGCSTGTCVPWSAPFKGDYVKLDPVLFRNTERAMKLATIMENEDLQIDIMRMTIRGEIDTVLAAMRSVGLLNITEDLLLTISEVIARYSWKVLGLDLVSMRSSQG